MKSIRNPLAEKYYGWSGYNYVLGNPIGFTDPTGMGVEDDHVFDQNGAFVRTVKNDNPDRVLVENSVTKKIENIFPINGSQDPERPIRPSTRLIMISESQINQQMIDNGSATTTENPYVYLERESRPSGDKSILSGVSTGRLDHAGNSESLISSSDALYVAGGVAYNDKDFGNFLWGQVGKTLGVSKDVLLTAAHLNNFFNGESDNRKTVPLFDTVDDQTAIFNGYFYPQKAEGRRVQASTFDKLKD